MVAEVDTVIEGYKESIGIPGVPVSMDRGSDQRRIRHLQLPDNTSPFTPVNKRFGGGMRSTYGQV
jgi:hypothetical protein